MAKFNIESAYRTVPVYPEDRVLFGMSWKEQFYIDTTLPFGLGTDMGALNPRRDSAALPR
jgi:hypothetical protein